VTTDEQGDAAVMVDVSVIVMVAGGGHFCSGQLWAICGGQLGQLGAGGQDCAMAGGV